MSATSLLRSILGQKIFSISPRLESTVGHTEEVKVVLQGFEANSLHHRGRDRTPNTLLLEES